MFFFTKVPIANVCGFTCTSPHCWKQRIMRIRTALASPVGICCCPGGARVSKFRVEGGGPSSISGMFWRMHMLCKIQHATTISDALRGEYKSDPPDWSNTRKRDLSSPKESSITLQVRMWAWFYLSSAGLVAARNGVISHFLRG